MDTETQTTNEKNDTGFGKDEVIARLGVAVLTDEESKVAAALPSTALAKFRAAPTIKALSRDVDAKCATTSENLEGARRRFADRKVMVLDKDGNKTDMPLFVSIRFDGARETVNGVPDIGVSAEFNLSGIGMIRVEPIFVEEIQYVGASSDGTLVGIRSFLGQLYAPTHDKVGRDGKKPAYKFAPLEIGDVSWIERWNGIIDQGATLGTVHKDWTRLTPLKTKIGQPGQRILTFAPSYLIERSFPQMRNGKSVIRMGKPVMQKQYRIASRYLKIVVLSERSQYPVPVKGAEKSGAPFGRLVFSMVEKENSLVVTLKGREGEVSAEDTLSTIAEVGEQMNPFQVLDTEVDRFLPEKARAFIDRCLGMPINGENPLYRRALALQLVIEGQPRSAIRTQLRALADEAFTRAKALWEEAMYETWKSLQRFELPDITACLAGNTLELSLKRLNENDVAAAWLTSHISGEYMPRSPFHRELRSRVLKAAAKRVGYRDPKPEGNEPGDNIGNKAATAS